jgi:hypothetical protein
VIFLLHNRQYSLPLFPRYNQVQSLHNNLPFNRQKIHQNNLQVSHQYNLQLNQLFSLQLNHQTNHHFNQAVSLLNNQLFSQR